MGGAATSSYGLLHFLTSFAITLDLCVSSTFLESTHHTARTWCPPARASCMHLPKVLDIQLSILTDLSCVKGFSGEVVPTHGTRWFGNLFTSKVDSRTFAPLLPNPFPR